MDAGIPDDFDVIVIGTGLPESILASACARVGLTVLHVDCNDYYGDSWASFNLEQLLKWVDDCNDCKSNIENTPSPAFDFELASSEKLFPMAEKLKTFSNVDFRWMISDRNGVQVTKNDTDADENEAKSSMEPEKWTKEKISNDWRRFCIDLAPKVLLSRGEMVNLLVESNVGRYAEFKNVDRILTFLNGSLKNVPCSRSDVFQSQEINMIEKRMLMKFLTFCLNYQENISEWQEYRQKSFENFLNGQNLTPLVRHYILNALAMVSGDCPTEEGLRSVNEFLMSSGRYGSSPFLWTVYGSGELPQCFCRLCAVFGGVYCLRCDVQALIVDQNEKKISAVVVDGRRITCRHLVANTTYLPRDLQVPANQSDSSLSRAVLITDRSLIPDGPNHISLLNVQFDHLPQPVKILELGHGAMVCPKDLYVVHLTTLARGTVEEDLDRVVETFFSFEDDDSKGRPRVLSRMYFNHTVSGAGESESYSNLIVSEVSNHQFNYDSVVKRVRASFKAHFPDAPFLERREEPTDEGMAEPNDPGINGFTPDPQPEQQAARPTAVSATSAAAVEEHEENVENNPLRI